MRIKPLFTLLLYTVSLQLCMANGDSTLTLLFVGDVMGHGRQIRAAYNAEKDSYDYSGVFKPMHDVFNLADFTIANLEVTLAGKPYTGYPQFSSPDALAVDLSKAGVDVLVTANNHSADRRSAGIRRTIRVLDSLDIPHTGTFTNETDRQNRTPLIIEKNGIRIALLNYTYGTNGIPVKPPVMVNRIDTALIRADIQRCKQLNVDETVVFIHWGREYQRLPSKGQRWLARKIHSYGARLLIGSHPHVIQPMEAILDADSTYSNVTVFSLGNFVSNQRKRFTNGGVVVWVSLLKTGGRVAISGVGYIPVWVHTPTIASKRRFRVYPVARLERADSLTMLSAGQRALFDQFRTDTREWLAKHNVNFPEITFNGKQWMVNSTANTESAPELLPMQ